MKILRFEQTLPISIETAWNFFSRPEKLSDITPKYMRFRVQSSLPEKIYAGLTIQYKVSLLFNIPVQWVTEIARVEEPHYFVDHQKKGPYRIWQHEHYFEQKENGTLMTDIVRYDIGRGILGNIAGKLLADRKVRRIFAFRRKQLEKIFPAGGSFDVEVKNADV